MILKTTKTRGRGSHDHMMYIGPDGVGVTSPGEDGHFHPVQVLVDEATQETQVVIGEARNHSHDPAPLTLVKTKGELKSKEDRVAEVLELYKARKEALDDTMKRFDRDRQIYLSNQWPNGAETKLKKKNRAHHNINEIKPKIDLIAGYLTENRTKRSFMPVEGDDGAVAEILNYVNYNIDAKSNYSIEEALALEDQLQRGMGVLSLRIDTQNNLQGEVIEEHFNPEDVLFGPHEKLDASDCEFAIKRKWISRKKAEALFPELKDKIAAAIKEPESMGVTVETRDERYDNTSGKLIGDLTSELFGISKKNIRILEMLKVEYRRVPVIFNVEHNFYFNAEKLPLQDLQAVLEIPLLSEQRKVFTQVSSTTVLGSVFAEHKKTPFKSLPIRPIYCVKDGDEAYGLIHFVRDLQNMANKSRSQFSDIINRSAEYVWLVKRGALTGPQLAEFKSKKVEPGEVIELEDPAMMQKVEGTKIPSEVLAMEDRYASMIFDHMGGNSVLLGQASTGNSALLFREFKKQALQGLEYLQRNLHLTKKAMAKVRLEAIAEIYTPERIARLVNVQTNFHLTPEAIEQALMGIDMVDFDVEIIEDVGSSTYKREQFAIWAELLSLPSFAASIPPQISLQFLLEMANPPGKDKFVAALGQFAESQRGDELTAQEAEVMKSQPDDVKRMKEGLPPEGLTNEALGFPSVE